MKLEIPTYNLNFKGPIIGHGNFTNQKANSGKCKMDRGMVERKIALWDFVIQNNLMVSSDSRMRARAVMLLQDKTIMSYAYFKKDGKPFVSRWYQDVILVDDYDRILFIGSNQIGKSLTLDIDAATEFIKDHGKEWRGLLVSNSLVQSKERMSSIRQFLDSSVLGYKTEIVPEHDTKTGKQISMTVVTYTFRGPDGRPLYTNKLICCPHTSAALGYPCNELWLDEIEFWDNVKGGTLHWVKQVAIPRTFDTHGKIKAYSNPLEGGIMHRLSQERDPSGGLFWHVYRFNYWDREDSNQKFFDRSSIGMTRAEIASTLLGDFARAEGAFLSKEDIEAQFCPQLQQLGDNAGQGKETFWFLDVGEVHDQCCLVGGYALRNPDPAAHEMGLPLIYAFWIHKYPVGYPIARVVGATSELAEDDGWAEESLLNPPVLEVLKDHSEMVGGKECFPLFGCDVTNNTAVIPLFQSVDVDPVPIKFSGQQKWHMYQRYQMYSQQRWFKRVNDRDGNEVMSPDGCLSDFAYQASKLRIRRRSETGTRYGQIHHEVEGDLDDTQDSVVGMIYLIECPDFGSGSFDIINEGVSVLGEVEKEQEENREELRGQYIPKFMDRSELDSWIDQKEKEYR